MSFVAEPASVPMVTTASEGSVLSPSNVAVTVTEVAASSSPKLLGLALSVMPVGASSSSVIVVLTDDVPMVGEEPPPPDGLDIVTVNVSPVPSSMASSVVCAVKVWSPAAVSVNVSVPDAVV